MDLQIWSKVEEKRGVILALRGDAVHRIGISGRKARREVPKMIEALEQGQEPASLGAGSVETLKVGSIGRAEVNPEKNHVKFRAEGDDGASLKFSTSDYGAAEIARLVLARAGRAFHEERHDLGPLEALFQPALIGAIIGFFWWLLYNSANQLAAGGEIKVGNRRRGLQQIMIQVAEMLGVNGTLMIGAALLALILGWAAMRVVRRPQRTVWELAKAG